MEKRMYYFTFGNFGGDDKYLGCVQPILASDWGKARDKMFDMHGDRWAFQYTEKSWNEAKQQKKFNFAKFGMLAPEEKELPVVEGD